MLETVANIFSINKRKTQIKCVCTSIFLNTRPKMIFDCSNSKCSYKLTTPCMCERIIFSVLKYYYGQNKVHNLISTPDKNASVQIN